MTFNGFVKTWLSFVFSLMITLASASVAVFFPDTWRMTPNGTPVLTVVAMLAGVWCLASLCTIITVIMFQRKGRPVSEGLMIGRLYRLLSIIGMILVIAYGFGKLEIIKEIHRAPEVDLAIPFIYSYRAGLAEMDRREADDDAKDVQRTSM